MSFSRLKESSEKPVASIDIRDTEQAGLTEKIRKDLDNPNCALAKRVQEAVFKAWGTHIKFDQGKLVMVAAKGQDR